MTSDPMEAFFQLHRDLPREGPGEPQDVAWAAKVAGLSPDAQMADVGCGPGGDIAALLDAAPRGHVTALDKTPHFVAAVRRDWQQEGRVTVLKADMKAIHNSYDMIWCAGAVYFMGVKAALEAWRKSLTANGVVAFSEACWLTDNPSARARALWDGEYPNMTDAVGVQQQISDAGYDILGTRRVSDAGWEAYYGPLEARIAMLRPQADAALSEVLDVAAEEIACWRAHRDEFGYLLSVVRPK